VIGLIGNPRRATTARPNLPPPPRRGVLSKKRNPKKAPDPACAPSLRARAVSTTHATEAPPTPPVVVAVVYFFQKQVPGQPDCF
jgi:hypothetical protein